MLIRALLLILTLLVMGGVRGQNPETACFPNCTLEQLSVDINSVSTELSSAMDTLTDTMSVADASGIVVGAVCWCNDATGEAMKVTAVNGNNLTVTRQFDSTPLAGHLIGAPVRCGQTAQFHNLLAANQFLLQANVLLCSSTSELTISGGVLTIPYPGCFSVDTELDAPSDDLDSFVVAQGTHFALFPADNDRTVVIKMPSASILGVADFRLDNVGDTWRGWSRSAPNVVVDNGRFNGGE